MKVRLPDRWVDTPNIGAIIANTFIPFKVPIDGQQWNVYTLLHSYPIGAIVDLTNTNKYYSTTPLKHAGVTYRKIPCRGHHESPRNAEVREFVSFCREYVTKHPNTLIGVHCTHGFNRTGFMICMYLYKVLGIQMSRAIRMFAAARPPGIYKQEYILDMYIRYIINDWCNYPKLGFPGTQPVSMALDNISFLCKHKYQVSWKADGVRYLMLVINPDQIYLLDRKNNIIQVNDIIFKRPVYDVLIDGELMDNAFLAYDIMHYENDDIGQLHYDKRSIYLSIFLQNIDSYKSIQVCIKNFVDIKHTRKLLTASFAKKVDNRMDGLIFQPTEFKYVGGQFNYLLKWKPAYLNTIDFKLHITHNAGQLMVGESDKPFGTIALTRELLALDGHIIECYYDNRWIMIRERTDKLYPNSITTARNIMQSIKDNISEQQLLRYISKLSA